MALPLAAMPVANCVAVHWVGVVARAVAVAALPVVVAAVVAFVALVASVAVAALPDVLEVIVAGRSAATMARQLALPLAATPVARLTPVHWLGVALNAAAVPALVALVAVLADVAVVAVSALVACVAVAALPVVSDVMVLGRSRATNGRRLGLPGTAAGVARTRPAAALGAVMAMLGVVDGLVTVTPKKLGTLADTLVTVPDPGNTLIPNVTPLAYVPEHVSGGVQVGAHAHEAVALALILLKAVRAGSPVWSFGPAPMLTICWAKARGKAARTITASDTASILRMSRTPSRMCEAYHETSAR